MHEINSDSSILFKNMLAKNKSLCGKTITIHPRIFSLLDLGSHRQKQAMGLITLHFSDFPTKLAAIGIETGLKCLEICLKDATTYFSTYFPGCRIIFIKEASPGDSVILFERGGLEQEALSVAYLAYRTAVARAVSTRIRILTGAGMELLVGFASVEPCSPPETEKSLFSAMCKAKCLASQDFNTAACSSSTHYSSSNAMKLLDVVYQPVVNLANGLILGWESLARGESGFPILDSFKLFEKTGSIQKKLELESALWRLALSRVGALDHQQKLFINVSPACLAHGGRRPEEFVALAAEYNLEPQQIVLEFSEKLSQDELAVLLDKVESYRACGFRTAIDDVGAGNSNLMLLARLRPDYIKADVSLMRDIESNPIKRVMIETLVLMAEKTESMVIAEGVETELALSSLVSMGVHAGQGFFLAQPAAPRPEGPFHIPIKASYRQAAAGEWKCSTPVGDLVHSCLIVESDDRIQHVKQLLEGQLPISSVVVVEGDKPSGLLMNYNLDKALSTKFGVDLYYKKRVSKLMDKDPLCVEFGAPIEEAACLAMNRDKAKIYDDIIVTRDGAFIGVVSVQRMLDTLAKVQMELAKGSNPLTGLPGNVAIELEFNRRAKAAMASSLIYIDLDNFKVFNDVYGFNQGDKAILLTAQILRDSVKAASPKASFIGHVGGDDFVVISAKDTSEDICRLTIEAFSAEVPKLYTPEDRKQGCVLGKNREGVDQCFPIMTMSISVVDCAFETPVTFEDLSHRAAEVKKFAKLQQGNSCVHDRRAPLGAAAESVPA